MDMEVYVRHELIGYAKVQNSNTLKLFNREGKHFGYAKDGPDGYTHTYYSLSGKKLMTAIKTSYYDVFNGHDTDLTLAYYFMYVY